MTAEAILFLAVGGVALVSAVMMVLTSSMVYSALYMVVVFLATAIIYLIYLAPLIALLQITVYAGGIMVLFLFVIMLIGAEKMSHIENLPRQRPLAFGLMAALLVETVYLASRQWDLPHPAVVGANFGSPQEVGISLFNQYLLPFEVVSILLLVALVGAVVLTSRKERRR